MRYLCLICLSVLLWSCQEQPSEVADKVMINGNLYTVDEAQPRAEAIAINEGRILKVGSNADIQQLAAEGTEVIDLQGAFAMPGLIEGHGHFTGIGRLLMNLNFMKAQSWEEIVAQVAEAAEQAEPGEWIIGRGWHQEKWTKALDRQVLGYPYHDKLSAVTPDNPVLLDHASGHSLFANAKAMELAGISAETPSPRGGEIVRDTRGQIVGVFEEKAQGLIEAAYQEYRATLSPEQRKNEWIRTVELAEEECLRKGITSFQDAGSSFQDIDWYKEQAEQGELDLRLWVMLRRPYDEMKGNMEGLPVVGYADNFFTCRAIKTALDGALGSFGAWLLRPYNDKEGFHGQNTVPVSEVKNIANLAWENDMQLCVHAIGTRANRETLDVMEETFAQDPSRQGLRWRIEHAQHLDTSDIPRFRDMGVIASMQGIHCTSDAPFVEKRLGYERAKYGSYPWRSLLDAGVIIANGTDAPVEDVDPLQSIYASVTRKRPDSGVAFFPEQSMTREEALYSYTMGNAYAAFEEDLKGSLTPGKVADIVVLSRDLSTCSDEAILDTEVMMTIVGGETRYQQE